MDRHKNSSDDVDQIALGGDHRAQDSKLLLAIRVYPSFKRGLMPAITAGNFRRQHERPVFIRQVHFALRVEGQPVTDT